MSDATSDSESETVIVIDNGSGFIKAGFAGNENPKLEEPSIAATAFKPKPFSYGAVSYNGRCYDPSQSVKKSHQPKRPIERGIIADWNHMVCLYLISNEHISTQVRNK